MEIYSSERNSTEVKKEAGSEDIIAYKYAMSLMWFKQGLAQNKKEIDLQHKKYSDFAKEVLKSGKVLEFNGKLYASDKDMLSKITWAGGRNYFVDKKPLLVFTLPTKI